MNIIIDYFNLYVEPKVIDRKRSLSQESMQRIAGEKLMALEGPKRDLKPDAGVSEDENQLLFLQMPVEQERIDVAGTLPLDGAMEEEDELLDSDEDDASVLSSLDRA